MTTTMTVHTHRRRRRRVLTQEHRDRLVYSVRQHPERFPKHIVEIVHNERERAILTIGTVYDWDCERCKRAVITNSLDEPCPHCFSPNGRDPESSHMSLGRAIWRNWQAKDGA